MQNRSSRLRRAAHPGAETANITSAVGMPKTIGRAHTRRTSLYTRVVMWVTGLVCTAFLLSTLAQAWSNSSLMAQVQKEQYALDQKRTEHQHLTQSASYYRDPAVIESEARQKLGYIRPGEEPVVIIDKEQTGSQPIKITPESPPTQDYWQQWWQLFFGDNAHR